jgi:hypothetical protein
MTEVADRNVLSDVQFEVAASGGKDERTFNGGRPYKVAVNNAFDVLEDGIAMIAGSASDVYSSAPSTTE